MRNHFVDYTKQSLKKFWKEKKSVFSPQRETAFRLQRAWRRNWGRLQKRYDGYGKYTIISACFNVEKYIDEFLESIVNQSLCFKKNFQVILVDDGSTDGTASKIKAWVSKYPENIQYVHQENGGQSSARNLGLEYAKNPWISFADPDDFFDYHCFKRIDDFLKKGRDLCFISMNLIPFYENAFRARNIHPLRYRFKKEESIVSVNAIGDFIQLSASAALLRKDIIDDNRLKFGDQCKPNFEDALFVNTYLSFCEYSNVAFLKKSKYFYRKRADNSSTTNGLWLHKGKFFDVLEHGYLHLIDIYKKKGNVPNFIQNLLIYECYWYFQYLINRPDRTDFLTKDEQETFIKLLRDVYKEISTEVIMTFSRAGLWFYYKVGILGCMKNVHPDYQIAYVEKYDSKKNEVLIRYFTKSVEKEEFFVNGLNVKPRISKTIRDTFLDQTFVYQRLIWLPLDQFPDSIVKVSINGIFTKISLNGQLSDYVTVKRIRQALLPFRKQGKPAYHNCWLISDREIQADDNGEHFYRYVANNHPERNIYFLLNNDSHDWNRLKEEGFNLIPYGSLEHAEALKSCSCLLSSHADDYVVNYFGEQSSKKIPFVFLQHGVTKDDLSGWLNSKNISLFVTTTKPEYDSIAGDGTRYRLTAKEVQLLGFPRHDALIKGNNPQNIILVMPTWRNSIMGKTILGNTRTLNPDFMDSTYAKAWQDFLCSEQLKQMADQFGYRVVFFPHSNIQPYLKFFNLPKYIEVCGHEHTKIQDLFKSASVMITDYSSVAFEMAVLEKPIVYYQFDYDEVFNKHSHTYGKGYFDYERDGFGDVCYDEDEAFNSLRRVLSNGCSLDDKYRKRVEETFIYRDGKNCERVYEAVTDLFD